MLKKLHTLFFRLDLAWAFRYFKKRTAQRFGYATCGRIYYTASVSGITIRLYFSTPYHWDIANFQASGGYEPPLPDMWVGKARSAALIFDVGGFNGFYGLLAAKANPKANVLIFEADPVNAEHIRRNILVNALGNAQCIEAAVSDTDGEIRFTHDGSSGSRVASWGKPVRGVRLATYGSPDLLKLDIEGHEPQAIRGADLSDTKCVFVEYNKPETLELLSDFKHIYKEKQNRVLERV